jgi:hypothetical protein
MRHSTTIRTLGIAGVVAVAIAAGAGIAGAADNANHGGSLHLQATRTNETVVSAGQDQIGTEFVDHWDVTAARRPAGTLDTVCQVTATAPNNGAVIQCVGTLSLGTGELTIQGVTTASEAPASADFDFAVTGGTGTYLGALGVIHIHQISETVSQADVKLER